MIGKITEPRGQRVEPLIYYLYGPGRHNEHTDPHLVAGWRHPAELEPSLKADGNRDFRALLGLLNQPHAAMGHRGYARPVWHCSVRAAPGDNMLSDDEWARIACEVMHRTGLAPYGQDDDAVRWVAVRHAEDHIHIVAMLARQDRARPSVHGDRYRVRDACLAAERRHGLRSTAPADRTAPKYPTLAETEKAARRGRAEPSRVVLRRHVATAAAASGSDTEFFSRLEAAGVLVRKRCSTRNPGQVTGYAVALPGDTSGDGNPVWYGGGKLAVDLTWPKVCHRWQHLSGAAAGDRLSAAHRSAIWDHAARAAADGAAQIRSLAGTDPAAAADAAWAASGTVRVAAAALGSRILDQAADALDQAARPAYGRISPPTPAGNKLRHAARLIGAFAYLADDPALAPLVLLTRLAALAESLAELRQAQQHATQAAAARTAAERLHTAARTTTPPAASTRPAAAAARLAAQAFPPATPSRTPPAPAPSQPAVHPQRSHASPRPRHPRR